MAFSETNQYIFQLQYFLRKRDAYRVLTYCHYGSGNFSLSLTFREERETKDWIGHDSLSLRVWQNIKRQYTDTLYYL